MPPPGEPMTSKIFLLLVIAGATYAADQTAPGAGNPVAEKIAAGSQLVQSARQALINNARQIQNSSIRTATLDAMTNPSTCITHRIGVDDARKNAIIQSLVSAGLINPADAAGITGGVKAGVFPPVRKEGTNCPQLPVSFDAAPGSAFHGHHSYPGGLPVHEANNDQSDINLADLYRGSYGSTGAHDLPVNKGERKQSSVFIDQDLILAAPMWHDWAKTMVFQWNADGTEFTEL